VGQGRVGGRLRGDGNRRGLRAGGHRRGHNGGLKRQHVQLFAVFECQWNGQMVDESLACAIELRAWPIEAAHNGADIEQGTALATRRGVAQQQWQRGMRKGGGGVDVQGEQVANGGGRHIGIKPMDGNANTVDDNGELNLPRRSSNERADVLG